MCTIVIAGSFITCYVPQFGQFRQIIHNNCTLFLSSTCSSVDKFYFCFYYHVLIIFYSTFDLILLINFMLLWLQNTAFIHIFKRLFREKWARKKENRIWLTVVRPLLKLATKSIRPPPKMKVFSPVSEHSRWTLTPLPQCSWIHQRTSQQSIHFSQTISSVTEIQRARLWFLTECFVNGNIQTKLNYQK